MPKHETTDLNTAGVGRFALFLIVFAIVVHVAIGWGLSKLKEVYPNTAARPANVPPAPRLEIDETLTFPAYREEKQKLLDGYGWVEGQPGIARIPIERAMEIYERR